MYNSGKLHKIYFLMGEASMLKKFMLPLGILLLAACGDNGVEEEGNEENETAVEEENESAADEEEDDEKWHPPEDNVEGPSEETVPDEGEGGSWKEAAGTGEGDDSASDEESPEDAASADVGSDSSSDELTDESIEEEDFDAAAASEDKPGFDMVKEDTFTNEIGQGVWEKYQEMTGEYELKDVANPESEGSSREEIEEMMSDMDIEPDSLELENGDTLIIYHFPDDELAHDNGEPFIMADVTYFFNSEDHLIHSSIAPGFHEVALNEATKSEELEGINTLTDLRETHDPQIFTIGEMKINEATITQTLIPVDAGDNTLAVYVYGLGDDIIYSNGDLYFTVSVDFPTYAYIHYADLVQAYSQS